MYGSGPIQYSLADEVEEIRSHRRALVVSHDIKSLVRWRQERSLYVEERHLVRNYLILLVDETMTVALVWDAAEQVFVIGQSYTFRRA